MEILQNKYCTITIDELGFIHSNTFLGNVCEIPAYFVLFRDYTRSDPFCRNWDTFELIEDVFVGPDWIKYTKIIESIEINCKIELKQHGWDWSIKLEDSAPLHHRFGVAVPWKSGRITSLEKDITTPVAQYCNAAEHVFCDQTLLTLPVLTCEADKNYSVFGPMNCDYHFFTYEDNEIPYCRITSTTSRTNELAISFRVHSASDEEIYTKEHPHAENYIYQWKSSIHKLETKHQIKIQQQLQNDIIERTKVQINLKKASNKHIEKYWRILEEELSKYPHGFFKKVGIDIIILCGGIVYRNAETTQATGSALGDRSSSMRWILIDISQNDKAVIHHEIFHFLVNFLNNEEYTNEEEKYADVFAEIMTGTLQPHESSLAYNVLKFCPEISISQTSDFQYEIYMCQNGKAEPVFFGSLPPKPVGMNFCSNKKMYWSWQQSKKIYEMQ